MRTVRPRSIVQGKIPAKRRNAAPTSNAWSIAKVSPTANADPNANRSWGPYALAVGSLTCPCASWRDRLAWRRATSKWLTPARAAPEDPARRRSVPESRLNHAECLTHGGMHARNARTANAPRTEHARGFRFRFRSPQRAVASAGSEQFRGRELLHFGECLGPWRTLASILAASCGAYFIKFDRTIMRVRNVVNVPPTRYGALDTPLWITPRIIPRWRTLKLLGAKCAIIQFAMSSLISEIVRFTREDRYWSHSATVLAPANTIGRRNKVRNRRRARSRTGNC